MSEVDSRLLQLQLAIEQRVQMAESRYCLALQLQRHDNRLLSALKAILQQDLHPVLPAWFLFLKQSTAATISLSELAEFAQPEAAWVLLYELKCQLQSELDIVSLLQSNAEPELTALYWQLLRRRKVLLAPALLKSLLQAPHESEPESAVTEQSVSLFWYLGCSGQTAMLDWCQQVSASAKCGAPTQAMARFAASMLGLKQSPLALLKELVNTELLASLGPEALMLLVASASPAEQQQLINYLAGIEQLQQQAILAMGYSRAQKYATFLLSLYPQTEFTAAVTTALDYILGLEQTDQLLQQLENTGPESLPDTAPIAGSNSVSAIAIPGYQSIAEQTLRHCELHVSAEPRYLPDSQALTLTSCSAHL